MKRTLNSALLVTTALLALSPVTGAVAAEEPAIALEEIVVTAEKRETSLQTTPLSISAVTAATIEDANVTNTVDLQFLVPNVTITNANGSGNINIRGFGSSLASGGADPSSTLHLNGVYMTQSSAIVDEFLDVERVEVLRGPQGTLYGRNAVGGTVNIITKKPSADLEYNGSVQYGSHDTVRLTGVVSGPLSSENVRGRLAVLKKDSDGFLTNVATGKSFGEEDIFAMRAGVDIDASETVSLLVNFDYNRVRTENLPYKVVGLNALGGIVNATPAPGKFDVSIDAPTFRENDDYGVTAILDWDLDSVAFKSITGFRDNETNFLIDLDVTDAPVATSEFLSKTEQFSQEFQLTSQTDGPLEWIVGLYYLNTSNTYDFTLRLNPDDDPVAGLLFPVITQAGLQDNTLNAYAAFGQASYALTEELSLTAGMRYSYEKKRNISQTGLALGDRSDINFDFEDDTESWDAFTPRVVLDYALTEDLFFYGSISRGFKSGGYDLRLGSIIAKFDPEFIWNYEVGAKTSWLDKRLQMNVALFWSDFTDQQVQIGVAQPNGTTVIETRNTGKSRHRGVEVEFKALPFENFRIDGSLGYLDAKFTDYPDVIGGVPINRSGERVPGAPKWTTNIGAQYRYNLGEDGDLVLRADYQWRSKNQNGLLNLTGTRIVDSYGLVNARLGFESADGHWNLSVFGKNLTNEAYAYSASSALLAERRIFLGDSRTLGLEIKFQN